MDPRQASAARCGTCGVEIPLLPAVHRGKTYCCGGCAQGGPCYCSYDLATLDRALPPVPGTAGGRSPEAAARPPGPRARRAATALAPAQEAGS